MPKTLLIVRKDNVLFKELADSDESGLFNNLDESLNSFRENQLLFEIENNRPVDDESAGRLENVHLPTDKSKARSPPNLPISVDSSKKPSDALSNDKSKGLANDFRATTSGSPTEQMPTKLNADEIKRMTPNEAINTKEIKGIESESHDTKSNLSKPLDLTRKRYIRALENDNCVLEQLLDDLELLKSVRRRTGRLNYGAEQLELIKRKLAHFLCRQRNEQLTEAIFDAHGGGQLFRDNAECLRFVRCILQSELNLKIDDDEQLNSDLNLYLRLKLKNELILDVLLRGLNVRHDSRPTVQRYVEQFRAKLEPRLLAILLDLQRTFGTIDRRMKIVQSEHNELLRRYYEILEQKELLQLRYFTREMQLVERFRTEIKQLRASNLSATNKANITERSVKRLQSKMCGSNKLNVTH